MDVLSRTLVYQTMRNAWLFRAQTTHVMLDAVTMKNKDGVHTHHGINEGENAFCVVATPKVVKKLKNNIQ